MTANELRVGNYVTTDLHGIGKIESISGVKILYDRNYDSLNIDKTDPIQLTEEWLLMLGFEKEVGDMFIIDSDKYYTIKILISNTFCYPFISDKYGGWFKFNGISHVHQLQNLYFALTGEELSVK